MGQMAYDLRRLLRKGIIERVPKTHRYQLTRLGRQLALFCTKLYSRVVCRGIAKLHPEQLPNPRSQRLEPLRRKTRRPH
jgi:hypothetical protein